MLSFLIASLSPPSFAMVGRKIKTIRNSELTGLDY